MFDIANFVKEDRACLIAPAGYGKTHTIVECLKILTDRQLVLTHTHAGVASLKSKLAEALIPSSRYELSTISAFAQRLAVSYSRPSLIEKQTIRNPEYFNWTLSRAKELVNCNFISNVIGSSYGGVFVDEYQDCTIPQHELILSIAKRIPLRAFGDPMQGIFGFKSQPIVNFDVHLSEFAQYELSTPYRWMKTNPALGEEIALLRAQLKMGVPVFQFHEIKHIELSQNTLQRPLTSLCNELSNTGPTVVIVSNSKSRTARTNVARFFNGRCSIVEAIDDKEFYEQAQLVDSLTRENAINTFYDIASQLFFKTRIDEWITSKGVIRKQDEKKRLVTKPLKEALDRLADSPSPGLLGNCLRLLKDIPGVTLLNHEKYFSLISASNFAAKEMVSVLDAMARERDVIRGGGRKIKRFSVGTTLLTKGLEFDNVIVVNCGNKFNYSTEEGRRHFYVAVSRARKILYIIDVV